ncbi:FAD-dependent monooxygenase [Actinacidiphila epipremni]|uniref:FAD-dependent oxidoreductase n=1 Tax=Actinacidiphila epipremni TaxID=2053013 RepID=A0ABX0ZLL9_9ACTN|nr:FAD-dependent monooxygenase [Actinacidiphila epipremni]NJP42749.1 FAD-dependent oxidoreductase [Actinacidiphila epipremni]
MAAHIEDETDAGAGAVSGAGAGPGGSTGGSSGGSSGGSAGGSAGGSTGAGPDGGAHAATADADVVIVGGGPAGLLLAAELGLLGVRPVVLERLPEPSREPKANGLVGQVVPALDRRGLSEPLTGVPGPPQPNRAGFMFAGIPLNLSVLPESPVHTVAVPQHRIVEVLDARARAAGAEIRAGHELVGLVRQDDAVELKVSAPRGGYTLRARYVVGADGAHSPVRKLAGIGFPGVTYDRSVGRHAHVSVPAGWADASGLRVPGFGTVPPFFPRRTPRGAFTWAPLPGRPPLIATTEWEPVEGDEPMSLAEMRASIGRVLGADVPVGAPEGEGPFVLRRLKGGNTRVAERLGDGRLFLVGDAAHVYASGGGPGLNAGLQDALNLGWKLAAQLAGTAPEGLLASYDTERTAAARRTLVSAQAQSALHQPGSDVDALRELMAELFQDEAAVARAAALIAGSDLRYDMGGAIDHPLLGAFAPDLALTTASGPVRLAELSRTGRPLLLDLTAAASAATQVPGWSARVDVIPASPRPPAAAPPFTAALIRPDGYVAWATSAAEPSAAELAELRAAGARWFGVG